MGREILMQMKSRVSTLMIAVMLAALGASKPPTTSTTAPSFSLDGHPIHPLSVQPLVGDLAQKEPFVAAVDLEGSARTASNRGEINVANGLVTARENKGYTGYRHIGTTPDGLYVLVVFVNGGGSGVFETALWVKLVRDRVSEDGKLRERTTLVKVGSFTLGDRDDGDVTLNGTKLLIGKSRYRADDTIITLE